MSQTRLASLVVVLLFTFLIAPGAAQLSSEEESFFVTVHLPYGLEIELPRSWRLVPGAAKEALATNASGDIDLSHMLPADNHMLLRATATPADQPASMSIAYLPQALFLSSQTAELPPNEIANYDQELRRQIETLLSTQGGKILQWSGTYSDLLNGRKVLVSEYRRQGLGTSSLWEQVNTIPLATGTVLLSVAYNEQAGLPWRAIVRRIRSSCHLPS